MISSCISFLYDSVNSKPAHSPPGICRVFVILSVPTVGNLSESLCPGMGHLSILLQAVNIIPFSICHLKICLFRQLQIFLYRIFFITYALKRYAWFSLHNYPKPTVVFVSLCGELLPAIVIRSLMEEKQSMHRLKRLKERHQPAWQAFEREGEGNQGARSNACHAGQKDTLFVNEWLRQ